MTRKLREDLWCARHTIIGLMPDAAKRILESYSDCVTTDDVDLWVRCIAADLIDLATPIQPAAKGSQRGHCPLCGDEARTPYERGFALPEGLRMHLEGKVNSRQCPVVEAARGLAEEDWDQKFGTRGAERDARRLQTEARRRSEPQYLIHPYLPARLSDEGPSMFERPRDAKALELAVSRLSAMGFRATKNGRLRAYTKETPNAAVYADPRMDRFISYLVFLKPVEEELDFWEQRRVPSRAFRIPDTRVNDLEQFVDREIAKAVRDLSPGLRAVS